MLMCSLVPARRQAGHILVPDLEVLIAELPQRRVHVDRVPEHDDVDDKTETRSVGPPTPGDTAQLASFAMEDGTGKHVPALPAARDGEPPSSAPSADAKPATRLITCRARIRAPSFKCQLSGL